MENKDKSAFTMFMFDSTSGALLIEYGLTKREYFAGLAMQGWIACQSENFNGDIESCISRAVKYADALLKELEARQ